MQVCGLGKSPSVQMGPRGRESARLGVEGAILLMDKIESLHMALGKWLQIGLQADGVVTVR